MVGAEEYTKCPPGTYGTEVNYSSVDDCITCPGGRKCPGASNTVITCPEGTYCPSGSSGQKACPIGYYCPSGSSNPIISPAGYYSEKYD